jgi:hypothetical protein
VTRKPTKTREELNETCVGPIECGATIRMRIRIAAAENVPECPMVASS